MAGLLEAISTPVNRNDLGRLAQMHSWGQALTEAEASPDNPATNAVLVRLATTFVTLLERLILDEAADPQGGAALIPGIVRTLEQCAAGQTVDADSIIGRMNIAIGSGPATVSVVGDDSPKPAKPAAAPAPAPAPAPVASAPPPPAAAPKPAPVAAAPAPAAPVVPAAPTAAAPAAEAKPEPKIEPYLSEPLMLDLGEREHLEGFLEEAAEHMDTIEAGLLEVEANNSDSEKLNELFRPFHTIKGIAGFLNLRDINRLTHEIETILDQGRRGETQINAGVVDLIFAAVDTLKAQLGAIRQYMAAPTGDACPQPEITDIMYQLRRAAAGLTDFGPRGARPTLGELLVASGAVQETDVDDALDEQSNETPPARKIGEILVARGTTSDDQVKKALTQQADAGKAMLDSSIRVDTTKLDALVDAVGELVIAQSMVGLSEKIHEDEKLARNVAQVTKIVRDVQETAMGMRMVPIGHTFQKMRRLVRDLSRKVSKAVELTISGEETELDKNVIQQISDPLVHLVRNAIDHGIERPEVRKAAGKPEAGQVQLNAYHQGDSIVIEIRDDGKGLDRDVLIAKGIERGLIGPEDQLSEQQAFALILQAGFSTAEKITDVSGRGVGMDVVKRNVEQLRGKIEIQSEKGKGSVFMIRLPLTLAIIDGMLVRVNEERMIIPTILIEQSLRPEAHQITSVQRRGAMVQVRGELCPLIQLGALFGYNAPVDPCENLVVIVQAEGCKIALVVEELIGQQQVVIKTLGERFKKIKGISGAAILGDGRVGLILEPSGVLGLHNQSRTPTYAAPAVTEPVTAAVENGPPVMSEEPASAPVEPALAAV